MIRELIVFEIMLKSPRRKPLEYKKILLILSSRMTLFTLVLGSLLLGACAADPPENAKFDFNTPHDSYIVPDAPENCPNPPTLPAPVIDLHATTTSQLKHPFRGVALNATQIIAHSGAGNSKPALVGADGKFCIEVELIPDAPNQIIFTPISSEGCFGNTTQTTITHKTKVNDAGGGSTAPQNLALGSVIRSGIEDSDEPPEQGQLLSLIDGDVKTWANFEMYDFDASSTGTCDKAYWLLFDLGKTYTVTQVKAYWGSLATEDIENYYPTCYDVVLSSKMTPDYPDVTNPDWAIAKQITDGTADPQDISFSPASARWVAILMMENAGTGIYENFNVAEIEIWGVDPDVVPPDPVDTCQ